MMMKKSGTPLEKDLWEAWFEKKDPQIANELVKHYMYLVTYHVERVAMNVPNNVHRDDLTSLALIGLYDALNKFEPERGLKFDTYASFRLRGSIIDGLRKEDWLPRSHREKTKQIEAVTEKLQQKYQRVPSSEEIANKLNTTSSEVESLIRDSLYSHVLSIEEKVQDHSSDHKESQSYVIEDDEVTLPDDHVMNLELQQQLVESMQQLNKNEQQVISLFYQDELTMTEIGKVLHLTTSRISQIHKSSLFKLRKTLQKIQAVEDN